MTVMSEAAIRIKDSGSRAKRASLEARSKNKREMAKSSMNMTNPRPVQYQYMLDDTQKIEIKGITPLDTLNFNNTITPPPLSTHKEYIRTKSANNT